MLNASAGIAVKILTLITAFAVRTVLIKTLGIQYTGVSGLFTDILTVLSFAELGIGSAIIYALYKPIAENDKDRITCLMNFYKKAYRIVAIVVLILGTCVIPFLGYIVKEVPDITESIRFIYILYIINTATSYLFIYKSTLLTASQNDYVISSIKIIVSILKSIAECMLLIFTKNFIIYLLFGITINLLLNILISKRADREYPFMKEASDKKLPKEDIQKLFKDVKALFFYKISGVVLNGTDSIVISAFLGTGLVGYIGNYNLIINQLYGFIMQIFSATSASIGNLAASSSSEKQYSVFKTLLFLAFWIYCFSTTSLWTLLNPFITIWLGQKYIFSNSLVFLLLVNFYIMGMLSPISSFRTSNGLFVQGQYRPIIMAIINVVSSVILVRFIGLSGVILGTIISRVSTQLWYDPYLIYKRVFHARVREYAKTYVVYVIITIVCCVITQHIAVLIILNSKYLQFLLRMCVCAIIPNIILLLLYRKSPEFNQLKNIGKAFTKNKIGGGSVNEN